MPKTLDATIIVPTLGRVARALDLSHKLLDLDPQPREILFVFQVAEERLEWESNNANPLAVGILSDQVGAAVARNVGAAHAQSRYLVFLDDDCLPANAQWLDHLIARFERENVTLVTGAVLGWETASGSRPWMTRAFMLAPPFLTPWGNPASNRSFWCQTVAGGNFAVKNSTFVSHGGFSTDFRSPSLYEETELSIRFTARRPKSIWFAHNAAVIHNQDSTGGMRHQSGQPSDDFFLHHKRLLLESVYGRGPTMRLRFGLYAAFRAIRRCGRLSIGPLRRSSD